MGNFSHVAIIISITETKDKHAFL